jgi:hypothetical protein
MEFMFDDEVEEVGAELEAFCPKCKADTTHVVITKYEEEVRRVQCNPCGDVHSYRKPRGEAEEDIPEPLAAKKRAALKKPTWEEGMARLTKTSKGKTPPAPKPYSFRDTYRTGDLVSHPRFGDGFVSEVLAENKVEVTFKEGRKTLVHNRSDLTPTMLMATPETADEGRVSKKPVRAVAKAPAAAPPAVKAAVKPIAKRPAAAPAPAPAPKAKPSVPVKKPVAKAKGTVPHKKKAAATAVKKPSAARTASRPVKKLKKSR